MGTVEEIKERIKRRTGKSFVKACPICGSAPELKKDSLDYGNGHGYPGCYVYHYECGGCGIIKAGSYDTIYNKYDEAENKAAKDWNEVVDYVNDLIAHKAALNPQ